MEIDKLVVRLLGDNTNYAKAMSDARSEAERTALTIEKETAKVVEQYKQAGYVVNAELTKTIRDAQGAFLELDIKLKAGIITVEEYDHVMQGLEKHMQEYGEEIRRVAAEDARYKSQGEALTRKYLTAQERFDEELDALCDLLDRGVISQKTFGNEMEQSINRLKNSEERVVSLSEKLEGYGRTMIYLGGAIAGVFGVTIKKGVDAASQYETTVASFKTMIGSLEETEKTMRKLSNFAVEAPMTMPQIEQAAMGLIQFGERSDAMVHTLEILGNAAAGTGTHFNLLSSVFNQVRGVGHLLTGDFRQLSTRGVLSLQDIAKHFGVTENAAGKMLSTGKISFAAFKSILEGLSREGGRFHNMMADQSRTLEGQMAKLGDAMGIAIRDIGQKFMPIIKMATGAGNAILDYWKDVPDLLKTVAATVMGLSFALGTGLVAIGGGVLAVPQLIGFYGVLREVTWLNTVATKAYTLATTELTKASITAWIAVAAPVALAAAAVAAVVGTLYYFHSQRMKELKAETTAVITELEKKNVLETKEIHKVTNATDNEIEKYKTGDKKSVAIDKERQKLQDEMSKIALERNQLTQKLETVKNTAYRNFGTGGLGDRAAQKDAEIEKLTKRLGDLSGQTGKLADKSREYLEIQNKIKENGGITDEQKAEQEEIIKNLDIKFKKLRNIGDIQAKNGGTRLFDPTGLREDMLALEKLKEENFKPEVIEEQDAKQKANRKLAANNDLNESLAKARSEADLIGKTNKELQVKKYTEEGISKLHAEQLADAQFNLNIAKELNTVKEKTRDLGKTPHQLRKEKAEREDADATGMQGVNAIRDEENQQTIISMQQQLELLGKTKDEIQIINMLKDEALPKDIEAVKLLQEQLKERTRSAAASNRVRTENENMPDEIKKLKIANLVLQQNNDLWGYQKKIREDMQALELMRQTGVDPALIAENKKLREEQTDQIKKAELIAKGNSVREGLKKPEDLLKEELQRIQDAVNADTLSKDDAAKQSAKLIDAQLQNDVDQRPENKGTVVGSREYAQKQRNRDKETETKTEKIAREQLIVAGLSKELQQKIHDQLVKNGAFAKARP